MAVDIFANGIERKYADDNDKIFNLFSSKIKCVQRITSDGATFFVETVLFNEISSALSTISG